MNQQNSAHPYDILIFDPYSCDLIITGLPGEPRWGVDMFGTGMDLLAGGTFNTVRALHRLGLRVGWVCDFGCDLFSQYVLEEVRAEGVDDSLFRHQERPARSFSLAFSSTEERGFISYIDPLERVDRAPFVQKYRPKAVMLCSLDWGAGLHALAGAVHATGGIIAMDCQSTSVTLDTPGVAEALKAVDIFMPNAGEAQQLTGAGSAVEALEILSAFTPWVVIKQGSQGALARGPEGRASAPALAVEVIDTTGAGDCFDAGFLYSHLRGEPLEKSLRCGNICGGLSTRARGSVAAPHEAELKKYLD